MKRNTGKPTRKDTLDGVTKDDPEQSRRFVEAAKILETDKSARRFDEIVESISKHNKK